MSYFSSVEEMLMRRKRTFLFIIGLGSVFILIQLKSLSQSNHQYLQKSKIFLQNLASNSYQTNVPYYEKIFTIDPAVDRSNVNDENVTYDELKRHLPNLLDLYLKPHKIKNESCVKYPNIFYLEFKNIYWQSLFTSNGTFHLYSAYYDIRKQSRIGPAVRILGMINRIEPTIKTNCQFWFDNHGEPVFSKVMEYKYIWREDWNKTNKQGVLQPYLITCQIPHPFHKIIPASVSIVEKICDTPTNNLKVIYNKPKKKKGFAVCVKGLDFLHKDLSVRLVEWIEMIHLLGADKIFFYKLQVHSNISKVLSYYEKRGMVDVTPLTLPGGQPNIPDFQHMYYVYNNLRQWKNELIPYNDCFYRNIYEYEYIVLLDIDEIIMPVKSMSWGNLMDVVFKKAAINNETIASYHARNVYFLDDFLHSHGWFKDIPKYMHMLQHVYRSKNFSGPYEGYKSFFDPEIVLTLQNHVHLACLTSECTNYPIEMKDAQLHHYRTDCDKRFKENSVLDNSIWRFKNALISRTTDTLYTLGYFSDTPPK